MDRPGIRGHSDLPGACRGQEGLLTAWPQKAEGGDVEPVFIFQVLPRASLCTLAGNPAFLLQAFPS